MRLETGIELVEITCPACGFRWTRSYGLVHCETPGGALGDYFSAEGAPVPSPYAPDGAPACLRCARRGVARFVSRRACTATEHTETGRPAPHAAP